MRHGNKSTQYKRCRWARCHNNTCSKRPGPDVFFVPFPKPKSQLAKCLRWIKLCGGPNEDLDVDKIKRTSYVCSKHFVGGHGPTKKHPDPYDHQTSLIDITAWEEDIRNAESAGDADVSTQADQGEMTHRPEVCDDGVPMLARPDPIHDPSMTPTSSDQQRRKSEYSDVGVCASRISYEMTPTARHVVDDILSRKQKRKAGPVFRFGNYDVRRRKCKTVPSQQKTGEHLLLDQHGDHNHASELHQNHQTGNASQCGLQELYQNQENMQPGSVPLLNDFRATSGESGQIGHRFNLQPLTSWNPQLYQDDAPNGFQPPRMPFPKPYRFPLPYRDGPPQHRPYSMPAAFQHWRSPPPIFRRCACCQPHWPNGTPCLPGGTVSSCDGLANQYQVFNIRPRTPPRQSQISSTEAQWHSLAQPLPPNPCYRHHPENHHAVESHDRELRCLLGDTTPHEAAPDADNISINHLGQDGSHWHGMECFRDQRLSEVAAQHVSATQSVDGQLPSGSMLKPTNISPSSAGMTPDEPPHVICIEPVKPQVITISPLADEPDGDQHQGSESTSDISTLRPDVTTSTIPPPGPYVSSQTAMTDVFGMARSISKDGSEKFEYYCNFCMKMCEDEQLFMKHVGSHLFICGLCRFQTFFRITLLSHITSTHGCDEQALGSLQTLHLENVKFHLSSDLPVDCYDHSKPETWSNILSSEAVDGLIHPRQSISSSNASAQVTENVRVSSQSTDNIVVSPSSCSRNYAYAKREEYDIGCEPVAEDEENPQNGQTTNHAVSEVQRKQCDVDSNNNDHNMIPGEKCFNDERCKESSSFAQNPVEGLRSCEKTVVTYSPACLEDTGKEPSCSQLMMENIHTCTMDCGHAIPSAEKPVNDLNVSSLGKLSSDQEPIHAATQFPVIRDHLAAPLTSSLSDHTNLDQSHGSPTRDAPKSASLDETAVQHQGAVSTLATTRSTSKEHTETIVQPPSHPISEKYSHRETAPKPHSNDNQKLEPSHIHPSSSILGGDVSEGCHVDQPLNENDTAENVHAVDGHCNSNLNDMAPTSVVSDSSPSENVHSTGQHVQKPPVMENDVNEDICHYCGFTGDAMTVSKHELGHVQLTKYCLDSFCIVCPYCSVNLISVAAMRRHIEGTHAERPLFIMYGMSATYLPMFYFCSLCQYARHQAHFTAVKRHVQYHGLGLKSNNALRLASKNLEVFLVSLWRKAFMSSQNVLPYVQLSHTWRLCIKNLLNQKVNNKAITRASEDAGSSVAIETPDACAREDSISSNIATTVYVETCENRQTAEVHQSSLDTQPTQFTAFRSAQSASKLDEQYPATLPWKLLSVVRTSATSDRADDSHISVPFVRKSPCSVGSTTAKCPSQLTSQTVVSAQPVDNMTQMIETVSVSTSPPGSSTCDATESHGNVTAYDSTELTMAGELLKVTCFPRREIGPDRGHSRASDLVHTVIADDAEQGKSLSLDKMGTRHVSDDVTTPVKNAGVATADHTVFGAGSDDMDIEISTSVGTPTKSGMSTGPASKQLTEIRVPPAVPRAPPLGSNISSSTTRQLLVATVAPQPQVKTSDSTTRVSSSGNISPRSLRITSSIAGQVPKSSTIPLQLWPNSSISPQQSSSHTSHHSPAQLQSTSQARLSARLIEQTDMSMAAGTPIGTSCEQSNPCSNSTLKDSHTSIRTLGAVADSAGADIISSCNEPNTGDKSSGELAIAVTAFSDPSDSVEQLDTVEVPVEHEKFPVPAELVKTSPMQYANHEREVLDSRSSDEKSIAGEKPGVVDVHKNYAWVCPLCERKDISPRLMGRHFYYVHHSHLKQSEKYMLKEQVVEINPKIEMCQILSGKRQAKLTLLRLEDMPKLMPQLEHFTRSHSTVTTQSEVQRQAKHSSPQEVSSDSSTQNSTSGQPESTGTVGMTTHSSVNPIAALSSMVAHMESPQSPHQPGECLDQPKQHSSRVPTNINIKILSSSVTTENTAAAYFSDIVEICSSCPPDNSSCLVSSPSGSLGLPDSLVTNSTFSVQRCKTGQSSDIEEAQRCKTGQSSDVGEAQRCKTSQSSDAEEAEICKTSQSSDVGEAQRCKTSQSSDAEEAEICKTSQSSDVGEAQRCETSQSSDAEEAEICKTSQSSDVGEAQRCKTSQSSDAEEAEICKTSQSSDVQEAEICKTSQSSDMEEAQRCKTNQSSDMEEAQRCKTNQSSDVEEAQRCKTNQSSDMEEAQRCKTNQSSDVEEAQRCKTNQSSDMEEAQRCQTNQSSDVEEAQRCKTNQSSDMEEAQRCKTNQSSDVEEAQRCKTNQSSDVEEAQRCKTNQSSDVEEAQRCKTNQSSDVEEAQRCKTNQSSDVEEAQRCNSSQSTDLATESQSCITTNSAADNADAPNLMLSDGGDVPSTKEAGPVLAAIDESADADLNDHSEASLQAETHQPIDTTSERSQMPLSSGQCIDTAPSVIDSDSQCCTLQAKTAPTNIKNSGTGSSEVPCKQITVVDELEIKDSFDREFKAKDRVWACPHCKRRFNSQDVMASHVFFVHYIHNFPKGACDRDASYWTKTSVMSLHKGDTLDEKSSSNSLEENKKSGIVFDAELLKKYGRVDDTAAVDVPCVACNYDEAHSVSDANMPSAVNQLKERSEEAGGENMPTVSSHVQEKSSSFMDIPPVVGSVEKADGISGEIHSLLKPGEADVACDTGMTSGANKPEKPGDMLLKNASAIMKKRGFDHPMEANKKKKVKVWSSMKISPISMRLKKVYVTPDIDIPPEGRGHEEEVATANLDMPSPAKKLKTDQTTPVVGESCPTVDEAIGMSDGNISEVSPVVLASRDLPRSPAGTPQPVVESENNDSRHGASRSEGSSVQILGSVEGAPDALRTLKEVSDSAHIPTCSVKMESPMEESDGTSDVARKFPPTREGTPLSEEPTGTGSMEPDIAVPSIKTETRTAKIPCTEDAGLSGKSALERNHGSKEKLTVWICPHCKRKDTSQRLMANHVSYVHRSYCKNYVQLLQKEQTPGVCHRSEVARIQSGRRRASVHLFRHVVESPSKRHTRHFQRAPSYQGRFQKQRGSFTCNYCTYSTKFYRGIIAHVGHHFRLTGF